MASKDINIVIRAKDHATGVLQGFAGSAKKYGLIASGAIVGAFGLAIRSAVQFEDTFAGIRKTVDASEKEFQALSDNIKEISSVTPVATSELNKIGELAGQLGVSGVDNLTNFIDTIAKIAVTTNLTEEEASTSFARIANIMQEPIENVDKMGSSVVDLGNNFATTESEIVTFANRIAGAGKTAGLTTADLFGISTAFSSVGVQAERGGTAVSKVLFGLTNAVANGGEKLQQFADVADMTVTDFKKLFKKDAVQAFDAFVAGLGKNGIKATGLLEELELADIRLQQSFISVAGAGGIMSNAISTANEAFAENNALQTEAEKRFETTASQMQIAKNNLNLIAIEFGTHLFPILTAFLSEAVKVLNWFRDLSPATQKIILAVAGLVAVLTPLVIVTAKVITAVKVLSGAFVALKASAIGASVSLKALAGAGGAFALVAGSAVLAGIAINNAFKELSKFRKEARKSNENASRSSDLLITTAREKFAKGEITKEQRDKMLNSALIPVRANGGRVGANEPYMVGERGAEMFVPRQTGEIIPNDKLGSTVNINGNIMLGDRSAVDRFFERLDYQQEMARFGI